MEAVQAFVLGAVQGITEFLPISSSGHLILVPRVLGWSDMGLAFDAMLHLGTLLAIVVYFWNDLLEIIRGFFNPRKYPQESTTAWGMILGTIPVVIVGLLFDDVIEQFTRTPVMVLVGSVVGTLALIMAHLRLRAQRFGKVERWRLEQWLWIGLAQAMALFPGVSRSGITMAAAIRMGADARMAARTAFLLGIPAFLGAGSLKAVQVAQESGAQALLATPVLVGLATAFVVGYAVIRWLMRVLAKQSLSVFIWYRLVLAGVIAWLFLF